MAAGPLPVTVVGGYLGAGKTTLVNSLLRQANGRRLAVMVNEFGALPIDASLVEAADERIVSLVGRLCVLQLWRGPGVFARHAQPRWSRGRSMCCWRQAASPSPAPLPARSACSRASSWTARSCWQTPRPCAAGPPTAISAAPSGGNWPQADLILLNKCDLAGDADAVEAWLGEAAPDARVLRTVQSEAPIDIVLGAHSGRSPGAAGGGPFDHTSGYVTQTLDPPAGAEPEALARILADPAHGLLRAKGFARRPDGGMAAIQVVGSRWTVSDAPANAPAGLVCIGLEGRTDFAALRRAIGCP